MNITIIAIYGRKLNLRFFFFLLLVLSRYVWLDKVLEIDIVAAP